MLDWRNARTSDRPSLRNFTCADPANVEFDEERGFESHDAPWEFEVQEHVQHLNPPFHPPHFMCLGFDEDGLAAVVTFLVTEFDRHCFIPAVAVAHRASGRGYAGEAIDRVHNVLSAYGISDDYFGNARIDPDNDAAKTVFSNRGYQYLETSDGYELWGQLFKAGL